MSTNNTRGLSFNSKMIREDVFKDGDYSKFIEGINTKNIKSVQEIYEGIVKILQAYEETRNVSQMSSIQNFTKLLLTNYNDFFRTQFKNGEITEQILETIKSTQLKPSLRSKTESEIKDILKPETLKKELKKKKDELEKKYKDGYNTIPVNEIVEKFFETYKTIIGHYINIWGNDVFDELKSIIEDCFKLLRDKFKEQVISFIEDGYDVAKKTSEKLKELDYLKTLRDESIKITKKDKKKMSEWERKYQEQRQERLRQIANDDSETKRAGKSLTNVLINNLKREHKHYNEFSYLIKRGNVLRLKAVDKLSKMRHNSKFITTKNGSLQFFRGTRIYKDWKHSKIKGINSFLSFGLSSALLPIMKHSQIISKGFSNAKKLVSFGVKGVKNILKFGLNVVKFGLRSVKKIALLPLTIFNNIRSLFQKPFFKNILEFIKSDAGAIVVGTIAAFVNVFVIKPLKDNKEKWLKCFYDIKHWTKLKLNDIIHVDQNVIDKYVVIRNKHKISNKTNGTHYPVMPYTVLIWSLRRVLKIKNVIDFFRGNKSNEEQDREKQQKQERRNAMVYENTVKMNNAKNELMEIIYTAQTKINKFFETNKNLSQIANTICGNVSNGIEQLKRKMFDFLIPIGTSVAGGVIGSAIGGPLGAIIGSVLGGFIGEGINWLRKKANMRDDSMKLVTQYLRNIGQEREQMNIRYTELMNKKVGNSEKLTEKEEQEIIRLRSQGAISQGENSRLTSLRNASSNDINDKKQKDEKEKRGKKFVWSDENGGKGTIRSLEDPLDDSLKDKVKVIFDFFNTNNAEDGKESLQKRNYLMFYKNQIGESLNQLVELYRSDNYTGITFDVIKEVQSNYIEQLFEIVNKMKSGIKYDYTPGLTNSHEFTNLGSNALTEDQIKYKGGVDKYFSELKRYPVRLVEKNFRLSEEQKQNKIKFSSGVLYPLNGLFLTFLKFDKIYPTVSDNTTLDIVSFNDLTEEQKTEVLKKMESIKFVELNNKLNQISRKIAEKYGFGNNFDLFASYINPEDAKNEKGAFFASILGNNSFFDNFNLENFISIVSTISKSRTLNIIDNIRRNIEKSRQSQKDFVGPIDIPKVLDSLDRDIDNYEVKFDVRDKEQTEKTKKFIKEQEKSVSDVITNLNNIKPFVNVIYPEEKEDFAASEGQKKDQLSQ